MNKKYNSIRARIPFVLIIITVLLGLSSYIANAIPFDGAGQFGENDSLIWQFYCEDQQNNNLTIRGAGAMPDYESVKTTPWYERTKNMYNTVSITTGVTHIGAHAFEDVDPTSDQPEFGVSISDTVKSIGPHAFAKNYMWGIGLKNVESIGDYAYADCQLDNVKVEVPACVSYIGAAAFRNLRDGASDSPITIIFRGKAPKVGVTPFAGVQGIAYTPSGDKSWTAEVKRSFGGNIKWYESETQKKKISVNPKKTSLTYVKRKGVGKIGVKWKKVSGVSGYLIQYSTSRAFKKNVKKIKINKRATTYTKIKNLKKKKVYYVRARTYKSVKTVKNGITYKKIYYSKWSNSKSIKVK